MRTLHNYPVRFLIVMIALILVMSACNAPTDGTETVPAPTEAATTAPALPTEPPATPTAPPQPTETPAPSETPTETLPTPTETATQISENVTGRICFPGGAPPQMTLYFQEEESDNVIELPISSGETSYAVNLPPGEYIAYAWLEDFSRGGLYSEVVVCEKQGGEDCFDHDPQPFDVPEGQVIEGIDICDWFAPLTVPYPPGVNQEALTGDITGRILYPGGRAPQLKIVAYNRRTGSWQYYLFNEGSSSYTLPNLLPGVYVIVAYTEDGEAGGHANAEHVLIEVTVRPGQRTEGVDINDWNAPEGAFPRDPTQPPDN